jgi:hypothetical protein
MKQLDRDRGVQHPSFKVAVGTSTHQREQRPKTLAACIQSHSASGAKEARRPTDDRTQPLLYPLDATMVATLPTATKHEA